MLTRKKILWSWCDLYETTLNDLVYYDASIWVAYFLGEPDPHHPTSKHLVGLVESGEKRAIVSYLLIMETTHAIRKRIVQRSKSSITNRMMGEAVEAGDKFNDYVNNGLKSGRLVLVRSDKIPCHDKKVFKKTSSVQGIITNGKKYRALGHADVEHAYLADHGGALEFHTSDLSFNDLREDQDFNVKFVVHGGPPEKSSPGMR